MTIFISLYILDCIRTFLTYMSATLHQYIKCICLYQYENRCVCVCVYICTYIYMYCRVPILIKFLRLVSVSVSVYIESTPYNHHRWGMGGGGREIDLTFGTICTKGLLSKCFKPKERPHIPPKFEELKTCAVQP